VISHLLPFSFCLFHFTFTEGHMSDTRGTDAKTDAKRLGVLYLNHSGQISGAEQSLRSLLKQFRRAGAEVEPIIGLPGSGPYADLLRDEEFNVTFAPLRRIQRPQNIINGFTTLIHISRTAPFVTRLVKQTGAQLVHSNSTTAHLVGGLAAERADVPALWHVRDLVSLKRIGRALADRATWVLAISGAVAQRLQDDGVPPEKIRIVPNGLDTDEWRPRERSLLRESLGIGPETFVFGCVTQLVPWKNHAAFIEAAGLLVQDEGCANARFVIIGGDLWGEQQSYVKELRELVKKHNLQERFNFVPHQADNVDALSAVDCLVLPSLEEPFGRVLIEGMALEKVVVAYAAHGPLEIITNEQDGLLAQPGESESLAQAMRRAVTDADLRAHLKGHARNTVIQKFHIADSANRVLDIYREVLT
jgi:glycosyltransferase involved in cell wall biosynthesis